MLKIQMFRPLKSEPQGELSIWNLYKAPGDSDAQTGSQQSGQPPTPTPTLETPCTFSLGCLYAPRPWPDTPPRPSSSSSDCSLLGSTAPPTPRVAVPLPSALFPENSPSTWVPAYADRIRTQESQVPVPALPVSGGKTFCSSCNPAGVLVSTGQHTVC